MPIRPVVSASLAIAVLAGTIAALPARGAPAASAAVASAQSDLVVVELTVGSRRMSAGAVALHGDTGGSRPDAGLAVTPIEVDGTPYGEQRWTAASAPSEQTRFDSRSVAPAESDHLLRWEGGVVAAERRADDRGAVAAATASLGSVHLLGLPVELAGESQTRADVDAAGALSQKRLAVDRLALPSLVDLLGAVGFDVGALPSWALVDLVQDLGLADDAVRDAQAAVDLLLAPVAGTLSQATDDLLAADAAVEVADAALASSREALATAAETLDTAARALDAVTAPVTTTTTLSLPTLPVDPAPLLDPVPAPLPTAPLPTAPLPTAPLPTAPLPTAPLPHLPAPSLPAPLPSLPGVPLPSADPVAALEAYTTALAAYDAAVESVDRVLAQVALAERALAEALDRIAVVVAPARRELDALSGASVAALDSAPLVVLEDVEVRSRSSVAASTDEAEVAELVTSIGAVRVLGEAVLPAPLADVTSPAVDGAVADRLGRASAVLSDVAGLPRLDVPVPDVRLMQRTASTTDGPGGVGGTATSVLQVVTLSLPGMTVPADFALETASATGPVGLPLTATVLALGDHAQLAGQPAAAPDTAVPPIAAVPPPAGPGGPGAAGPQTPVGVARPPAAGVPATRAPGGQVAVPVASSRTLPRTGPSDAGLVLGVLLLGGALVLRRAGTAGRRV